MSAEHHIRNPFEYALEQLSSAVSDLEAYATRPHPWAHSAPVTVRRLEARDVWDALRKGMGDLGAVRVDVLFIGIVYPVAGLLLAMLAFSYNLLPLVVPMITGFALIGPIAAVGLYEISRRREQGRAVDWTTAFGVVRSPALLSILGLGCALLALFFMWLAAAYLIYAATLGPQPPTSITGFIRDVTQTPMGWAMAVIGVGVGFLFAATAFAVSVVSIPLLLDRGGGIDRAMATSVRVVRANPGPMSLWAVIVVGGLILGSLPALAGLIVVVPVLGHATWHLYRKAVTDA